MRLELVGVTELLVTEFTPLEPFAQESQGGSLLFWLPQGQRGFPFSLGNWTSLRARNVRGGNSELRSGNGSPPPGQGDPSPDGVA